MARRSTYRHSTVLNTLESQKNEIKSFSKHLETIEKYANTKVSSLVKIWSSRASKIYELNKDCIIIQDRLKITLFYFESQAEETVFQSVILSVSISRHQIFVLFSDSWKLLDKKLFELNNHTSGSVLSCGKIHKRGKLIITGDSTGTLLLWDIPSNRPKASIQAYNCEIAKVSFCNKTKFIISLGSDFTLNIFNSKLQILHTLENMKKTDIMESINDYIFLRDKVLIINNDGSMSTHFELSKKSVQSDISAIAVSSDETYFAVYDKKLSIYETKSTQLMFKYKCRLNDVTHLCFSRNNEKIYATNGEKVEIIKLFENFDIKKIATLSVSPTKMIAQSTHVYVSDDIEIYHLYFEEGKQHDENLLDKGKGFAFIAQNDLSKTANFSMPKIVQKESVSELDNSQDRNAQTDRVRKRAKKVENIYQGLSLKVRAFSTKIYGRKFSLLTIADKFVKIFEGDDTVPKTLYTGGNISLLRSDEESFLIYDSVQVKVFDIYPEPSERFSLTIQNVVGASLESKKNKVLLSFLNEFQLHDMLSRESLQFKLPGLKKSDFFGVDSNIYAITEDCEVYIYELDDTFPQGKITIKDRSFSGASEVSKNIFLFVSSDQGIEICSLQDFCHLSTIPIRNLTSFCISVKEKKIYYCKDDVLYSMINPVDTSEFEPILLNFSEISFNTWKWISAIISNDRSLASVTSAPSDFLIMPFCISQVLLLANSGLKTLLKSAIRSGSRYLRYKNPTLNPLTIAICRRNKDIIALLMKEIVFACSIDRNVFLRVEDNLVELNYKGSNSYLAYFYECMFYEPDLKTDSLAVLKEEPFLAQLSPSEKILTEDFLRPSKINPDLIEFRVSALRFKIERFTQDSVEFLDSIIWSSSPEILKTPLIQAILLHKWNEVKYLIYLQLGIFFGYLFELTLFVAIGQEKSYNIGILLILNTFFLMCEIPLINYQPINYIYDPWNVLDSARIIAFYVFSISFFISDIEKSFFMQIILTFIILVSWIRGLAFFRIFKRTRYLVNIIIEILIDVIPFILVLSYCILSFAFVGYSIDVEIDEQALNTTYTEKPIDRILDELKMQYLLNFGEINTSDYVFVDWIQFFSASIINTLILMSMIIALMGNTYERVDSSSIIAEYKEMASYILEIESMLLWLKYKSKKRYFQFCFSRTKLELGEDELLIDSKLKKLKEKVAALTSYLSSVQETFKTTTLECKSVLESNNLQTKTEISGILETAHSITESVKLHLIAPLNKSMIN